MMAPRPTRLAWSPRVLALMDASNFTRPPRFILIQFQFDIGAGALWACTFCCDMTLAYIWCMSAWVKKRNIVTRYSLLASAQHLHARLRVADSGGEKE